VNLHLRVTPFPPPAALLRLLLVELPSAAPAPRFVAGRYLDQRGRLKSWQQAVESNKLLGRELTLRAVSPLPGRAFSRGSPLSIIIPVTARFSQVEQRYIWYPPTGIFSVPGSGVPQPPWPGCPGPAGFWKGGVYGCRAGIPTPTSSTSSEDGIPTPVVGCCLPYNHALPPGVWAFNPTRPIQTFGRNFGAERMFHIAY